MTVDTKKVAGRRAVRYESYDDLLADAERLASGKTRALGNWTQGQIYRHLAMGLDSSIDGVDFTLPAPLRWVMRLLMKKKFTTQALPPGFKSTAKFIPDAEVSLEDALADLRRAIKRQQTESKRIDHPAFGKFTREEWDQFNLRHAEMHMSFLVGDGASAR